MSKPLRIAALCLAPVLLAGVGVTAHAAKDDLSLVSRASGAAGAPGDDASGIAAISADGRAVAFVSSADNLSGEDDNTALNVFVRDLRADTTALVSRASGATGAGGDRFSDTPSISADGRFVAFFSGARNLSGEDDDASDDVFVRDLRADTTTLVSRATGPKGAPGDRFSAEPSISADGRFVAFASSADNLSDEDDEFVDIFVRDLQANTTTLVSRGSDAAGAAASDGNSSAPSISADGRFVAFRSDAYNLSDADGDAFEDIFVRDLQERTTTLVSRAGSAGDGNSDKPSISADGRLVAFESDAENLSDEDDDPSPGIFVRDLLASTTTFVSGAIHGGALDSSISADGRHVTFEQEVNSPNGAPQPGQNIFVHDLQTNTTTFVSRASGASGAAADAGSFDPSISGDGRLVAFESDADGLSAEDNDAFRNVFVRDVLGSPPGPAPAQSPSSAVATRAPVLGRLRISPSAFRAAGSGPSAVAAARAGGAIVSFKLDRAAGVRFVVERAGSGRRVGGRCVESTRANRGKSRCTRYSRLGGGFSRRAVVGANRFRFTGRLTGRRLRRGGYRLVAAPSADGRRGAARRARFRVKR